MLGRYLLNQHSLVYFFFSFRSGLPRFLHRISGSITLRGLIVLICPTSALPDPGHRIPPLGSDPSCDGLAEASCLVATTTVHSLASPPFPRLPTHLYYYFVGSRILYPLHPPLYSRPRSRSHSRLYAYPRFRSRLRSRSRPGPRLSSRHRFLLPVPGTQFSAQYQIVEQALDFAPEAAGYLKAPPLVYIDNAACVISVFFSASFIMWKVPKLSCPPLPSQLSFLLLSPL